MWSEMVQYSSITIKVEIDSLCIPVRPGVKLVGHSGNRRFMHLVYIERTGIVGAILYKITVEIIDLFVENVEQT